MPTATGAWQVEGKPAPELDGIFDVDLESSSFTNAFPVHRLALAVGEARRRARGLGARLDARRRAARAALHAPARRRGRAGAFRLLVAGDFECVLVFDASGLVLDYPGIANAIRRRPRRS